MNPRPEPDLAAKKQMVIPANVTVAGPPARQHAGGSGGCLAGSAFVSTRFGGAASGDCDSTGRNGDTGGADAAGGLPTKQRDLSA